MMRFSPLSKTTLVSMVALLSIPLAEAAESEATTRESFDFDWKFAKFGTFDDCLARYEPGLPVNALTASSQEKANPAANASDGNVATRWCANSRVSSWLKIDLGRACDVAKTKIVWENKSNYRYKIFVSDDGVNWTQVVDQSAKSVPAETNEETLGKKFRYARINAEPHGNSWVSIREWQFFDAQGDKIDPEPEGENNKHKAFETRFDDSAWRKLDLPHDWGVESRFLPSEPNQTASLPWNAVGWYRKTFTVPAEKSGKKFFLDFDGVMMEPQVYVNGKLAGEWKYGYSSFRVDITPFLKFGEENVVAVRAQNLPNSSRWYPGAGIYRHTWLVEKNPVHIDHWGISVTTPKIKKIRNVNGKFFAESAEINVRAEIRGEAAGTRPVVEQKIFRDGKELCTMIPQGDGTAHALLHDVELWSTQNPALYTLETTVSVDGKIVDREETVFGIRKAEWRPDGFYLNGDRTPIRGVCQHQDLGPLGVAVNTRAFERQIEILKSFGVNSIRTTHNPPAPEFLDLCDRMGILVINELFDCWKFVKEGKTNGYNRFWDEWRERDVANFVRRDYNHPCIIAWSAGNEIAEQGSREGIKIARDIVSIFKKYDTTRPITVGCNDPRAAYNGFGKEFDVYGFNYKPNDYTRFANTNPELPFVGSETSSCLSTRGFYSFPQGDDFTAFWKRNFCDNLAICQVSDYGIYATGWGTAPDVEFAALENEPRNAGEYVWTGFDYLGEPTPWNLGRKPENDFRGASPQEIERLKAEMAKILKQGTPSRSSYFGIVDLCGFRKDRAYLYQSHWMPDVPMAHILPHWNWKGSRDGKKTPVMVYTSGDSAELFLNGKSLGKRSKKPNAKLTGKDMNGDLRERFRLVWMDVNYEPGTLEVVAYKDGEIWARDKVETTGDPATFSIEADRATIAGDGRDLSYITIAVRDAQGRVVPTANDLFKFSVSGNAKIVGVCNGDPTDHRSMKGSEMPALAGLAQVILQSDRDSAGTAELTVDGGALGVKTLKINIAPAKK